MKRPLIIQEDKIIINVYVFNSTALWIYESYSQHDMAKKQKQTSNGTKTRNKQIKKELKKRLKFKIRKEEVKWPLLTENNPVCQKS